MWVNNILLAKSPPNFVNFITLVWHVVQHSKINNDIDDKCPTFKDTEYYSLLDSDRKALVSKVYNKIRTILILQDFLQKMIRHGGNSGDCTSILIHLSWNNTALTTLILRIISTLINDVEFDAMKPIFEQFEALLAMEDNLQEERINVSIAKFLEIIATKQKQPKKTRECMFLIRRAAMKNDLIMEHYNSHPEKWHYVISWFDSNIGNGAFFRKK
jgi:hypothetical protein